MSDGLDPDLVKWLDGKFDALATKIDESDRRASDSRRDVYKKLEEQARALQDTQHELATVKRDVESLSVSVEASKPTLAEFSSWKAQAVGAGRLGRILWIVGGALLFSAFWLVTKWDAISAGWKAFTAK